MSILRGNVLCCGSLKGTALGDNGKPGAGGAGSGATEWVMDWASGEEARVAQTGAGGGMPGERGPYQPWWGIPWTGDVLDTTEAIVARLERQAARPGGGAVTAAQVRELIPPTIPAATRQEILQRIQRAVHLVDTGTAPTWIPGVPNAVTAVGGGALGLGLLYMLLRGSKKGARK